MVKQWAICTGCLDGFITEKMLIHQWKHPDEDEAKVFGDIPLAFCCAEHLESFVSLPIREQWEIWNLLCNFEHHLGFPVKMVNGQELTAKELQILCGL